MSDIQDDLADRFGGELTFLAPAEQFDSCIAGVAERCGLMPTVVYRRDLVIQALMKDGIEVEEAEEFLEFNIIGSFVGEQTPLVMDLI